MTRFAGAPQADGRQLTAGPLDRRAWREGRWLPPLVWATGAVIDLDHEPADHGLRNARAAVVAAVGVGAIYGAREWQGSLHSPFLARFLIVDALVAFVLTPLVVSLYLALPELVAGLLRRLCTDAVIDPAAAPRALHEFADDLARRLSRDWMFTAFLTVVYFAYALRYAHATMTVSLGTFIFVASLVAQAAIFYLAVVAVVWMLRTTQEIGKLLNSHDDLPIRAQPLHPDGCGGLWIVGHMLTLVLYAAAILASVGVGIFLALSGTPVVPTRRVELYLLGLFYVVLLPSAWINLLWLPHQLLDQRRDQILTPVAKVFDATMATARPSLADNAARLKAKADSLSDIKRQFTLLDEVCPVWPLRIRRLQRVTATAILPVAVSVAAAVLSHFLTN